MAKYKIGNAKPLPTQAELKRLFDYDPEGFLVWKVARQKINIGDRAGNVQKDGYTRIIIDAEKWQAHRLIYQWHEGDLNQDDLIDHKTAEKDEIKDNRIENLRKADVPKNGTNRGVQANSSTGVKGVFPYTRKGVFTGRYRAMIQHEGVPYRLGYYENIFDGYFAYRKKERELKGADFIKIEPITINKLNFEHLMRWSAKNGIRRDQISVRCID